MRHDRRRTIDERRVAKDERQGTIDERRRTKDEKALKHASIVPVSGAKGRPTSVGFKDGRPSSVAVILFLLLLSSCGYRFTPVGGMVPEGARTIAILAFVNNTTEPAVDVEVTKAVVAEFLADGRLKVVSSEEADLVLKGIVKKFEVTPAGYTSDNYVQSYSVSIGVNVSVEDVKNHKAIWQGQGLDSVFMASYPVTPGDITATKIAKETALKNASRDVASTLRSRLLEGF